MLRIIDKYFKLKPSSIGDPDIYLGSKLNKMRLENGVWAWANSPESYFKESVANVEKYLTGLAYACWHLPKKKAEKPFKGDNKRYMEEIPVLGQNLTSWYQSLIGMLVWVVEIGRVNIFIKV